ncbi:hypothetical protein [Bacteroides sp. UBA939]|uniref:hypothetical protein n=1 Tax=Bacteroides sp. UBA939 TaxID=1946092 RepID=UPI0025BA03A2|nr:hypothetical protein [Bacteroides sp. UBA939]
MKNLFSCFVMCVFLLSCSQEKIEDVDSGQINPVLVDSLNNSVVAYAELISPIIQKVETRSINGELKFTKVEREFIAQQLIPSISWAKQVMYSMGVTEQEIKEICGSDESSVVTAALHAINSPEYNTYITSTRNVYVTCALAVLGFDAFSCISQLGETTLKRAAIKLLKSAAMKLLGPIGVGLAVAEYGLCLAGL